MGGGLGIKVVEGDDIQRPEYYVGWCRTKNNRTKDAVGI